MITSVDSRRSDVIDDLTRRKFIGGGISLAALLTACGSESNPAPSTGTPANSSSFPVTIEHKYGSTTITEGPQRVVALGETDLDALLALGVVPVAASKYLGQEPGTIFPWDQPRLGGAPRPEVLDLYTAGVPFERIAALQPDLIMAVYTAIERADYDRLAKIAPTVAQPQEFPDYGTPWQQMTSIIGRAVGQPERADQLVADIEVQLAKARDAHPEFAGATAVVAYDNEDGTYSYWPSPDVVGRFLAALGFEVPAELAKLPDDTTRGQISGERLNLFDTDVLVWWKVNGESGREKIRANPLYASLDVATQGRDIFLVVGNDESDVLNEAIGYPTVLSVPFLLDNLVPHLTAAVDGDPATR